MKQAPFILTCDECTLMGRSLFKDLSIEGREQIIRFGRQGDIIGFRSVLSNEPA